MANALNCEGWLLTLAILCAIFVAGIVGGILAGMAGAASIVTFPAMLLAVPAPLASPSNVVALTYSNLSASLADPERAPRWDKSHALFIVLALVGGLLGSLLYVAWEQYFTFVIPALVGFTTLMFASQKAIARYFEARGVRTENPKYSAPHYTGVALCGIYGGYFGGAMTIVLLAVLRTGAADFRTANVLKNQLAGWMGIAPIFVYLTFDKVACGPTLAMVLGAIIGGHYGGSLASRWPESRMRAIVVGMGVAATLIFACKYWFGWDILNWRNVTSPVCPG